MLRCVLYLLLERLYRLGVVVLPDMITLFRHPYAFAHDTFCFNGKSGDIGRACLVRRTLLTLCTLGNDDKRTRPDWPPPIRI